MQPRAVDRRNAAARSIDADAARLGFDWPDRNRSCDARRDRLRLFRLVGRLTWGIAGSVIFGIVLVFGSAQIVQFFQSAVGQ